MLCRATARQAIFGMPTGQANRACLLNSACLRASGASPRHSAIFCARSSKRTVRLISGVALDECLDPERYRTRVPAFARGTRASKGCRAGARSAQAGLYPTYCDLRLGKPFRTPGREVARAAQQPGMGEWMIGLLDYWDARTVVPSPSGNPRIHYSMNPFRARWV